MKKVDERFFKKIPASELDSYSFSDMSFWTQYVPEDGVFVDVYIHNQPDHPYGCDETFFIISWKKDVYKETESV